MSSKNKADEGVSLQLEQPWTDGELRTALPFPDADANKFTRGVLTVIAGSKRYPGAACLAAHASQRMGTGYTEVVTAKAAAKIVLESYPSLVVYDVDKWAPADMRNAKKDSRHAVCIGPGFVAGDGRSESLVLDVLKKVECPVLVDGGGLAGLGSKKALKALEKRRECGLMTVVTPHAGEASRLQAALGVSADGPAQLSAALAAATGAIVVMKGPDTYISAGERVYPMYEGTSALAKAGTGDVLAGMISALLAQGVEPVRAAVLGSTLHARAGIAAAEVYTEIGVAAEDVTEAIPVAIRSLVESEVFEQV